MKIEGEKETENEGGKNYVFEVGLNYQHNC